MRSAVSIVISSISYNEVDHGVFRQAISGFY